MTIATQPMTADDLWSLPADNMRHELVKGELRTMAPPGSEHGAVEMRLGRRLATYVEDRQLGVVFGAESGFLLSRNPDTVRCPDAAFVQSRRIMQHGLPKGYWPGAPDLAVEVVSPSDTVDEVEEKVDQYLNAGTLMVWVVNPRRKTVAVYRPETNPMVLRDSDTLDGGNVVPGFRCTVAEIMPWLPQAR